MTRVLRLLAVLLLTAPLLTSCGYNQIQKTKKAYSPPGPMSRRPTNAAPT